MCLHAARGGSGCAGAVARCGARPVAPSRPCLAEDPRRSELPPGGRSCPRRAPLVAPAPGTVVPAPGPRPRPVAPAAGPPPLRQSPRSGHARAVVAGRARRQGAAAPGEPLLAEAARPPAPGPSRALVTRSRRWPAAPTSGPAASGRRPSPVLWPSRAALGHRGHTPASRSPRPSWLRCAVPGARPVDGTAHAPATEERPARRGRGSVRTPRSVRPGTHHGCALDGLCQGSIACSNL